MSRTISALAHALTVRLCSSILAISWVAAIWSSDAWAALNSITQSGFASDANIITFETGSTVLPIVPGVSFLNTSSSQSPWYDSSSNFTGFFGSQGWSNIIGTTYSDLGVTFAAPVQAIGGYVGRIPNFANQHPPSVVVELFDSSLASLGTASITLPPAFNSPVFFGFTADSLIASFRMTGKNLGFFGVDNFTYGSLRPVPEPATLTLLALGAVGLLAIRRRLVRNL
jgi:PEP-CTERM motif